ncbi:alpha/beta hydrolase [Prescottella sp. R16]|uniref:alpha/beta hydrolase n=1 Tax=Prescottella sp. R16 TaxID=3064529 RepID=UPI00272E796E|nr:alpha/beta hydrolase [Prescottella sp. R16]
MATLIAVLLATVMIGAYFPSIPKVGLFGPVLGGQYPFHMALFALCGTVLALLAWRAGLRRWGAAITAIGSVALVAALGIGSTQIVAAAGADTDISWRDVGTQLAYPGTTPDAIRTYTVRDGEPLDVDVYLPAGHDPADLSAGKIPAAILAHAGGFHTFDKADLRGTGRWLADRGVAVFAVQYRLATQDRPTWEAAPQDLVTSLRWVREHADEYGLDPDRIALGGMSAGGTLAMNTAYRLQNGTLTATDGGPTPPPPASVVGFYPGNDVTEMWERDVLGSRNAAELFTGGTPDQVPDRYAEVSPLAAVGPGLPPTLLVVGDRDHSAPPASVRRLHDELRANGDDSTLEVLPFADHAFDDAYGSLPAQHSRQILLDFLTSDKNG